jgi:hypothetical protein
MNFIYIGDHFYTESGTMMSSIYDEQGNRQDWGKVQMALKNDESVNIRPATREERERFKQKLEKIKAL